ncbi:MAG: phage minor head protein [Plesiomonas shigelloides]
MAGSEVDLGYAIGLPPAEAIRYFESKGYVIGFNWHDVEARTHATAFTVAGVLKQDILHDIRLGLESSLKQGGTLRDFEQQLLPLLQQKGWLGKGLVADSDGVLEGKQLLPRRLKTIFETNMQSAYSAGRYDTQRANAEMRPYWTRVAIMDTRTRPRHAALNGFTARYDDPVWQFMYPPDGFGCRCRVRARSDADISRENIPVQSSEGRLKTVQQAWGPNDTREVQALRINGEWYTPDAGFGHNPGQGALSALGQRLLDKATVVDAHLATLAVETTLADPSLLTALSQGVKRWVNQTLLRSASGQRTHVGAVSPSVFTALEAAGFAPVSPVLSLLDSHVIAMPGPLWEALPTLLRSPVAVAREGESLIYIVRHGDAHYGLQAQPDTLFMTLSGWQQGNVLSDETVQRMVKQSVRPTGEME